MHKLNFVLFYILTATLKCATGYFAFRCSSFFSGILLKPTFYYLRSRIKISCCLPMLLKKGNSGVDLGLPDSFQALYGKRIGQSFREVAEIRTIDMAEISPQVGEVVVKVLFAGINGGCETFRARGDHIFAGNRNCPNGFPLGAEGSGIVVALGSGVSNVAVGSHVSFLGSAFAEYVRLRADGLIVVPDATAETAALRISGVTACGVLHTGQAKAGDVVLITAAAGASGHFAVQLAKQAGCTVVGTCSSDDKARCAACIRRTARRRAARHARATRARAAAGRLLCELGCDDIVNVAKRDLPAAVGRRHPGGVDVLLDHVGGPLLAAGLACLREGGRAVLVGYIRPAPCRILDGSENTQDS